VAEHTTEYDARDERSEVYSVARIRQAFAEKVGCDEWGVKAFYEDSLIASLRGEYDGPGCRHRFPDGTRCTLSDEAHAEVPGLSEVHRFPPGMSSGSEGTS